MHYFQPIDIPDTCYVQEAAYWLAFGRLPQWLEDIDFSLREEDLRDDRMGYEARQHGDILPFDDAGYSEQEFASLGVFVDYSKYAKARAISKGRTGEEMLRDWDDHMKVFSSEDDDQQRDHQQRRERVVNGIPLVDWAIGIDDQVTSFVDEQRVKVFQALLSGSLKASGWLEFSAEQKKEIAGDRRPKKGKFVDIPNKCWTYRYFDWERSELRCGSQTYLAVQVETVQMLKVFPVPSSQPLVSQSLVFPGVVLIEDNDGSIDNSIAPAKKRAGRPPKQGVSVRESVQRWYLERVKSDNSEKLEASVQAAIEFADKILGQSISRTTAQQYLSAARNQKPEIMPEIIAGK